MDIPALSMAMSSSNVSSQVSLSLMKKSLDSMEQQGAQLAEMIGETGAVFDIKI